jgi:hypothetical protein
VAKPAIPGHGTQKITQKFKNLRENGKFLKARPLSAREIVIEMSKFALSNRQIYENFPGS